MANAIYPKAKESWLQGGINMASGDVRAALVDTASYTYSASHQYYSSVSSAVVGTPVTLTSKTFTDGVFKAANSTFTAVSGATVEAVVIYVDTGNAATSPLIAYVDSGQTGLPVTPNGGDIVIAWSTGANGIFKD